MLLTKFWLFIIFHWVCISSEGVTTYDNLSSLTKLLYEMLL
jgi:hypothetical protein